MTKTGDILCHLDQLPGEPSIPPGEGMGGPEPPPQASYVMGHDDRERRRLALQAAILNPLTEQLLQRAGISTGMHVLDLGCGIGEVSLMAARLVGRHGAVTAIDIDQADALNRVEVRAPQAGIILGVKVKSPGAVIQPGATLAELVPPTTLLTLSAKVSPLDVQNVAVGQKAQIRFPAFSTRSTPPLCGRVETVSGDAVSDETAKDTYFSARIIIDAAGVPREIADKLVPGMPADVLIITGERTVLAYFLGPIKDRLAKAMRES